jgi:hypothetical protein
MDELLGELRGLLIKTLDLEDIDPASIQKRRYSGAAWAWIQSTH